MREVQPFSWRMSSKSRARLRFPSRRNRSSSVDKSIWRPGLSLREESGLEISAWCRRKNGSFETAGKCVTSRRSFLDRHVLNDCRPVPRTGAYIFGVSSVFTDGGSVMGAAHHGHSHRCGEGMPRRSRCHRRRNFLGRTGRRPPSGGAVVPAQGGRSLDKTMKAAVVRAFGEPLVIERLRFPDRAPARFWSRWPPAGSVTNRSSRRPGRLAGQAEATFHPRPRGCRHRRGGGGRRHLRQRGRPGRCAMALLGCGHCSSHCLGGWETLCESQQNTGYSVNGSFADYVIANPNYVGHIPRDWALPKFHRRAVAGVTVYKGLKVTDTKRGIGSRSRVIGGLGHMAVQYAVAMGLNVVAVDVDDAKLRLAEQLGAALTVNARTSDPVAFVRSMIGGAHGVLVTAVSTTAFAQAIGLARRGGTVALNGLPPGDFPLSIFDTVLNGITVRGSIVGTRLDLQEALDFAARGRVRATFETAPLESINDVLDRMRRGAIEGGWSSIWQHRRSRCTRHRTDYDDGLRKQNVGRGSSGRPSPNSGAPAPLRHLPACPHRSGRCSRHVGPAPRTDAGVHGRPVRPDRAPDRSR